MTSIPILLLALALQPTAGAAAPVCGFEVQGTYPHDPAAFTQGLFYANGELFESTGNIGTSWVRRVRLDDGVVLQQAELPVPLFGEGITNWGNQIISITWQNGVGYRWDQATLRQVGSFRYSGEGWGLTQNGREIIMSDGTAELRFLEPETMQELRRIRVTDAGRPVERLNELEWVRGEILANVWLTDRIARIDPATGRVLAWIDLAPLRASVRANGTDDVLNGIAYDEARDRLFVTGKNWPTLFEIKLEPCSAHSAYEWEELYPKVPSATEA